MISYNNINFNWVGVSNPIFPKAHRNLDLGIGKNGEKRILKIEKIHIFTDDAPKFGFGDGKKWEKKYMKRKENKY